MARFRCRDCGEEGTFRLRRAARLPELRFYRCSDRIGHRELSDDDPIIAALTKLAEDDTDTGDTEEVEAALAAMQAGPERPARAARTDPEDQAGAAAVDDVVFQARALITQRLPDGFRRKSRARYVLTATRPIVSPQDDDVRRRHRRPHFGVK